MRSFAVLALSVLLFGCGQKGPKPASFQTDIQPILNSRCVPCHGTAVAQGGILLASYENVMSARTVKGKRPLVVPGSPAESWLYTLSATDQPHFRMPPDSVNMTPLPKNELEVLARWITQGAKNN